MFIREADWACFMLQCILSLTSLWEGRASQRKRKRELEELFKDGSGVRMGHSILKVGEEDLKMYDLYLLFSKRGEGERENKFFKSESWELRVEIERGGIVDIILTTFLYFYIEYYQKNTNWLPVDGMEIGVSSPLPIDNVCAFDLWIHHHPDHQGCHWY